MLDKNALSQLKELKQNIEDSKEFADGIVKGTQRKFGFVVLEDGREVFLSPDEMEKVFPGDSVKILIKTELSDKKDKKPKISGILQKLLSSPLKQFNGRYIVKGQGHFVEPDLPTLSRWIFIPPAARKNAKPGDYIRCEISRHPYTSAKPQAKIIEVIGSLDQKGIEAQYMVSKFQLAPSWPENWREGLNLQDLSTNTDRQDNRDIDFITIDAASTMDMDDALYARPTDDGWELQVAIADPDTYIVEHSPLDKLAEQRGTSVYMPGKTVPMLPAELANDLCSLTAGEDRPALLCTMMINSQGDIVDFSIAESLIRSRAKLSYHDVAGFLDNSNAGTLPEISVHGETLKTLQAAATQIHNNRRQNNLVIPSRPDYRMLLNPKGKLERIEEQTKSSAHLLVEECMIAANRCAANFLGEKGVFVSHPGFRRERLPDVSKLAEEQLSLSDIDASSPDGYRRLINAIDDQALEFPLRDVLSRLLERAKLNALRVPHYGMGMAAYTSFTSPIRKYSDLLVHRLIKAKLKGTPTDDVSQERLDTIQQSLDQTRLARSQMEQWLKCQFMEGLQNQQLSGTVSQVNSSGFTVRLNNSLIEGFVETRTLPEKFSFDPMRMRLKSKSLAVELKQVIEVVVQEVDSNKRSIRFTLPQSKETGKTAA